MFETPELLNYSITFLLAIKFKVLGHKDIKTLSVKFIQTMLDKTTVEPVVKD